MSLSEEDIQEIAVTSEQIQTQQALERVRMESNYSIGPFAGRGSTAYDIDDALGIVDKHWKQWGEEYLCRVLEYFHADETAVKIQELDR